MLNRMRLSGAKELADSKTFPPHVPIGGELPKKDTDFFAKIGVTNTLFN